MHPREGDVDTIELELLVSALEQRWGYDLRHYGRRWLRRRIREHADEEQVASMASLQHALLRDGAATSRLIARLSKRPVSMFRPSSLYLTLRDRVVPTLRTYPFVRIWVVGCATGEEAYSLAILLHEEGLYERARIYATDLSDALLGRARTGVFELSAMRGYEEHYRAAGGARELSEYYVSDGEQAIVRRDLRKNIVFSQHDLASDASFNEFNLVVCRNVVSRYDDPLRERAHRLVHESLARFGILALGKKETLEGSGVEHRYHALDASAGLYRRIR